MRFSFHTAVGWPWTAAHPEMGGFFSYNGIDGWVNPTQTNPGILTERYSLNPAWVEKVADAMRIFISNNAWKAGPSG